MNDSLLLGIVFAVVVLALYFLYRSRRRVQQRCPACHRFGRGDHFGRYRCSACGVHFVLDSTGRPSRGAWDVVQLPVAILVLVFAFLVVVMFTGEVELPVDPLGLLVLVAYAAWEIFRAIREKLFGTDE